MQQAKPIEEMNDEKTTIQEELGPSAKEKETNGHQLQDKE